MVFLFKGQRNFQLVIAALYVVQTDELSGANLYTSKLLLIFVLSTYVGAASFQRTLQLPQNTLGGISTAFARHPHIEYDLLSLVDG